MRVLFLSQVLPYPLDAGPKFRNYYVLQSLAREHQVTLVAFIRSDQEREHVQHLSRFCREVHLVPITRSRPRDAMALARSLVSGEPFLIARDSVAEMKSLVRQLVQREHYDVVHADQLAMAQYASQTNGARKVLDDHNAMWTLVQRLYQQETSRARKPVLRLEWRKTRTYEAEICQRFDHVFCVSDADRRALQEAVAAHRHRPARAARKNASAQPSITTIPICIDPEAIPVVERNPLARNAICVGGMFYPPNVDGVLWYAREVLPIVQREVRDSQFYVVGARPDPAILAQAERNPAVLVTGYVPDTTPFLEQSGVFVVPLRSGGGMRVKILEAWARGIPVVSTTIGCEGIEVKPEENILIADTPEEFARATTRVLCEPELGSRLAVEGRRWVQARYNWRTRYMDFGSVYSFLAGPERRD